MLADTQALPLGHSPSQSALKDLGKKDSGLGPFPFKGLGVCLLSVTSSLVPTPMSILDCVILLLRTFLGLPTALGVEYKLLTGF